MRFFLNFFLLGFPTAEGKNDKRSKKEEKVMSPKILQNPIDHIGNRGDTIRLNCIASGYPPPEYRWNTKGSLLENRKKDGVEVKPDLENSIIMFDGSLIIQKAEWPDRMKQAAWAGTYQCIAENVSGRALSRNITVQSGYIKKRFEKQPKDVEVRIGQAVHFDCQAPKGFPPPIIRWEKENQPIKATGNIRPSQTGLTILNSSLEDDGKYTCIAENVAGSVNSNSASVKLADLGRPTSSIECRANGSPTPVVFWELDGTRMTEASGYRSTLRLGKEGIYKCVAESRAGSSTKSVLVYDAQMNSNRVPPIVKRTVDYVEEGFTADCAPTNADHLTTYRWTVDNNASTATGAILSLPFSQSARCEVFNSRGSAQVTFYRGAAPTSGLSSEGLIRQIYVKESGDGVQVDWYKNDDDNDGEKIENNEMELSIFALNNPDSSTWQLQRANPPIFLSDKLRRQSPVMIFARDRDTTAGDSILLPQKEVIKSAAGKILEATLKNSSLHLKWENKKCDLRSTILIQTPFSGPIHTSCNQNSYVIDLSSEESSRKMGIVKMKISSGETSQAFTNEVIFSRRSNTEQTALVPVLADLFFDAEAKLIKWELSDETAVVSSSSGLVGFRIELRLGKTIYSADLSRDLRQISPDRVLKGNLAEIRQRKSIEATLMTLSHVGTGSATSIQFNPSGIERGFFLGFFDVNSTQHAVAVAVLVAVLAIVAICLAAFKGRQICRKMCRKDSDSAQWPITEEIFSKVERITHGHQTPSEPSNTSQPSLPPYASIECVNRNDHLAEPFLLPPKYSVSGFQRTRDLSFPINRNPLKVMNNTMHQYSTFQHHQIQSHQRHQDQINTFLRTEPLSPLESSSSKFKSCPMIIDVQTGYCTLPPPPPTPPISKSEEEDFSENDSFLLNSTAETSLTPASQKMTLPRSGPTMGVAATCLRRLPLEED
ncbi:Oidioi.mRNA.OKI2018_I69.PAR.g9784.t2.cds [Oikopleura dioica]|uniref:Oidioi.mRNA.OKI2018_I69.PAR.g9784.t2.cds n=1 Tax=Oikopleura dioica TaxID=34765 RepID=A0ABN7RRF7_OIKDI|nr:Oidioi.mRNA.OKI2018_I69.PAR.g9784.t2.cds [Oikopleura dioica]